MQEWKGVAPSMYMCKDIGRSCAIICISEVMEYQYRNAWGPMSWNAWVVHMATKFTYKMRSGGKRDVGLGTHPTQTDLKKKGLNKVGIVILSSEYIRKTWRKLLSGGKDSFVLDLLHSCMSCRMNLPGWPSVKDKLEAVLVLLNGLYRLEKNFILEKEKLYLEDLR